MLRINVRHAVRNGAAPAAAMGIFAALSLFAALAACGGEAEPTPTPPMATPVALSAEDPPASISEYYSLSQLRRDGAAAEIERLIAAFGEAIERDPDDAVAHLRLGTAYAAKWVAASVKNRDDALLTMAERELMRAIALDSSLARAHINRGELLWQLTNNGIRDESVRADLDNKRAIFILDGVIASEPYDVEALLDRARAREGLGLFDAAIQDYDTATALDSKNADIYYRRGSARAAKRDYHNALRDFAAALSHDEYHVHAYNGRGDAYYYLGEFDLALEDFATAISLNPDFQLGYSNLGWAYLRLEEYDKAIEEFDKALAMRPLYLASIGKAAAHRDKEDYKTAIQVYGEVIERHPDKPLNYLYRGNAHLSKGNYVMAIRDYDAAIERDAWNSESHYLRGLAYTYYGHTPKAKESLERALELGHNREEVEAALSEIGAVLPPAAPTRIPPPTPPPLPAQAPPLQAFTLEAPPMRIYDYLLFGMLRRDAGAPVIEAFIGDLNADIQRNPDDADTYAKRGAAYLAKHRTKRFESQKDALMDMAIHDLTRAIELDPKLAPASMTRMWAHIVNDDEEKAIQDADAAVKALGDAISLDPDNAGRYIDRGWVHSVMVGQYRDMARAANALADFDAAAALDQQNPMVYFRRSAVHRLMGNFERTIQDLDTAIRLDFNFPQAHSNRGLTWYFLGEYEKAIADNDTALRLAPGFRGAYEHRGYALIEIGEYEKAILDFDASLAIIPNQSAIRGKAFAYIELGDFDSAIQTVDEGVAQFPDAAWAYYERGSAYHLQGNLELSIRDYDTAIELDDDDDESFFWRGQAHAALGDAAKAREDFLQALALGYDREAVEVELKALSGGQ